MKVYNYIIILILIAGLTAFSSCSKSSHNPLKEDSSFSMKLNGKSWNATLTSMMSEPHQNQEWGDYHTLFINANHLIENNNSTDEDDLIESITILLNIPEGKFRNPKGTYPFSLSENEISKVWALYGSTENSEYGDQYIPISGSFEITDSEVGMPKVFGQETGKEGYTQIKGKFQLEMKSINGNKTIKITDGKFNLNSTLSIN